MTDDKRSMFAKRYNSRDVPWDTGITPPEIVSIVAELPPGKALDLGCGTGTNVLYLLQHDWEADGIDFVEQAIVTAQTKLADFPPEKYGVFCHDVTRLDECEGLRRPYDLVIDIGCGHGVDVDKQAGYAKDVATLLKPAGTLMLFAHEPTPTRSIGWYPADIERLFTSYFEIVSQVLNDDTTTGVPSGWYRLARKI